MHSLLKWSQTRCTHNEYRIQALSDYVYICRDLYLHFIVKFKGYSPKIIIIIIREMHKYSNNYHKNTRQTSPVADVVFLYKILHLHNNVQRKKKHEGKTFTS